MYYKLLPLLGMHTNIHSHIIEYMANQKICMMDDGLEKLHEDF